MKKRLVIVSDTIRRDFQQPLNVISDWDIYHLYRNSSYADMKESDFSDHTIKIKSRSHYLHLLHELKPDVIQLPEPTAGYSRITRISWKILGLTLPGILFANKYKVPVFFHMLENVPLRQKYGLLAGNVMKLTLRWCAEKCFALIVLNNAAKAIATDASVSPNKIERLLWGNWGVDVDEFIPNESKLSKHPYILFVGRITEMKGVPWLLKAWQEVYAQFPNAQLHMLGSGDLESVCKNTPGVIVHGTVKHSDIPHFFQQSWVTVTPSVSTKTWAEQVGMVNLQSLACGTPVITTDSGAIPEYAPAESGAVLIPERDASALTKSMIYILQSETERRKRSIQGRAYAIKHYDASINAKRAFAWLSDKISR